MSTRERQRLDDAEGKLSKPSLPGAKSMHPRRPGTAGSRLLLWMVMLVAGAILLSCSGSAGNANNRSSAVPTRPPVPSPAPNSQPGSSSPPAAANAVPKEPIVAEPKIITPTQNALAPVKGARMAFVNQEVDFGDVSFGDVVRYAFEFKNVGSEPLKISKALVQVVEGC